MNSQLSEKDFIEGYINQILGEIKERINRKINLDSEKTEEVDKKMFAIIEDIIAKLINFNESHSNFDEKIVSNVFEKIKEKDFEKIRIFMELYYVALYYDNVELLKIMLKDGVKLSDNFQYLNKSISSNFEMTEYTEMIKKCGFLFKRFGESIEFLTAKEKIKYIERFVKVIKVKWNLICEIVDKKDFCMLNLEYLFCKKNLDKFDEETYYFATIEQLYMISSYHLIKFSDDTKRRLNQLMQSQKITCYLYNLELMMQLYNDEELAYLTSESSLAINKFSKEEGGLEKIVEFINERPDLALKISYVSKENFIRIDNKTLIQLCDFYENPESLAYNRRLPRDARILKAKSLVIKLLRR